MSAETTPAPIVEIAGGCSAGDCILLYGLTSIMLGNAHLRTHSQPDSSVWDRIIVKSHLKFACFNEFVGDIPSKQRYSPLREQKTPFCWATTTDLPAIHSTLPAFHWTPTGNFEPGYGRLRQPFLGQTIPKKVTVIATAHVVAHSTSRSTHVWPLLLRNSGGDERLTFRTLDTQGWVGGKCASGHGFCLLFC